MCCLTSTKYVFSQEKITTHTKIRDFISYQKMYIDWYYIRLFSIIEVQNPSFRLIPRFFTTFAAPTSTMHVYKPIVWRFWNFIKFHRFLQVPIDDNSWLHCEHLQVSPLHVLIWQCWWCHQNRQIWLPFEGYPERLLWFPKLDCVGWTLRSFKNKIFGLCIIRVLEILRGFCSCENWTNSYFRS